MAATEAGLELVTARIADAMAQVSHGSLETVLRAISRAYLETCAREPEHTRAWVLELAAAGPHGVEARTRTLDWFAALMREIDREYGSGRPRPSEHYVALVGGITELVSREVRAGTEAEVMGELERIGGNAIVAGNRSERKQAGVRPAWRGLRRCRGAGRVRRRAGRLLRTLLRR